MANVLKMAIRHSIFRLYELGWSQRAIARRLQVDRATVRRYVQRALAAAHCSQVLTGSEGIDGASAASKAANPPTGLDEGWEAVGDPNAANPPLGSDDDAEADVFSNAANLPAGSSGRISACQSYRAIIEQKLRGGLSAQRIWQDLRAEHDVAFGYDSIKRFVRRLTVTTPEPFRRMECAAGDEAQVDFGQGAPIRLCDGRSRRPHVFRVVLSYSRKGYSEVVFHQDTETFLRCLENAFRSFGGVPRTVVIDNLKAAVLRADWYDPELTPKLASFSRHYGTAILPTRPYTPRHKGKIERGIAYVQSNALKGRSFASLAEQNAYLDRWEQHVADTRIHGTTRRQVGHVFLHEERSALQPLAPNPFPFYREMRRKVHRDGHVEIDKSYYSVPPEYVGREVWVRVDARLVRLFDDRMQRIAIHVRAEPGRFCTEPQHLSSRKRSAVERGEEHLLNKTQRIGPSSHIWARTMLIERGVAGLRVLQGFLQLTRQHNDADLERVCAIAVRNGCYRLKTLRYLLKHGHSQSELAFMATHPIIRDLSDYSAWLHQYRRHV